MSLNHNRYPFNNEVIQLDIPLDFDRLLRANKTEAKQWEVLCRVSKDCSVTQFPSSSVFEKIIFKATNSASRTTEMSGGHYVLPRTSEELDPKKIWVKIKSIADDTYFAAAKSGGGNLLTLSEVEPAEDEPTLDDPNSGLEPQQQITMEHYGATSDNSDQPKATQPNQQSTTLKHHVPESHVVERPIHEPSVVHVGTSKQTDRIQKRGQDLNRETDRETQMSFTKHTSELLKQTPSLAVIKEKSSTIHSYYIATTDQRFNPKRAVEFLHCSNGTVFPLYRCKISLVELSGLYEKMRSTNKKPKMFWKPYPMDNSFQLFTMPLSRKMSNHILTTVFCNQ